MSDIAVFVLDATTGCPAEGIGVRLEWMERDGGFRTIAEAVTDVSGSVPHFVPDGIPLPEGEYRLVYATGPYFLRRGIEPFHPEVAIHFRRSDARRHVVPLLLSPFGYTTYRGS
ncbi:MAG: hydroxyisourate hydrolase [Candidatus Eisenbacteria bacterium]